MRKHHRLAVALALLIGCTGVSMSLAGEPETRRQDAIIGGKKIQPTQRDRVSRGLPYQSPRELEQEQPETRSGAPEPPVVPRDLYGRPLTSPAPPEDPLRRDFP